MRAFIALLLISSPAWAAKKIPDTCPSTEEAVTVPAPVDTQKLIQLVRSIKDQAGNEIFINSRDLDARIAYTFDTANIKTKMEQFYRLLWEVSLDMKKQDLGKVTFSQKSGEDVLLESKVFTDPSIPKHIEKIEFDLTQKNPRCTVTFKKKERKNSSKQRRRILFVSKRKVSTCTETYFWNNLFF